jgi:glucoamylase
MPRDLPVGNGTVLVNFDKDYVLRDIYYPHVGKENQTEGHACRLGVWCDGQFAWIGPDWEIDRRYVHETLVTEVRLKHDGLGLEVVAHDAVDFHLWVFMRQFTVRDLTGSTRDLRLFFHHDFHIGENDLGDTAFYDPRTQSVIHYKENRWFLINAQVQDQIGVQQWATGTKEAAGMEGTWRDAEDGSLGGNAIAQGSVDSTVSVGAILPAGGQLVFHYWICFGIAYEKVVKLNSIVTEKTAANLIKRTENYWRLWIDNKKVDLSELPQSIVDLYRRSLLVIRTQIDEDGAIIAANDYDIAQFGRDTYSYMWPRDGALVAYALSRAGYLQTSQKFFNFCLDAIKEDGYLMHKYNPDGTVASSWHPWFRDGKQSLPIQEDETALVLWSLWEHFQIFQDVEFIKPLYRRLITNAAEFMVSFRDEETKLPLPSYDLWEERFGVHLFTVTSVIGGLTAAAKFAAAFGETEQSELYVKVAEEVRQAMNKHMWSEADGRFCRMATRTASGYDLDMTVDAACYGLFAFGALPADDARVKSTMDSIESALTVKSPTGGVARYWNDYYHQVSKDIDNVPGNPWFICTMWLAQYKVACAKNIQELDQALVILDWVVQHSLASGVLAEQVNPYTNEPLSVSPLTWSHATFVMCVLDYLHKRQELLGQTAGRPSFLSNVH